MHLPEPMLASTGRVPLARLVDDGDWLFEWKYDGVRVLFGWDGERCFMRSRNGIWLHDNFPELTVAEFPTMAAAGKPFLIDCELQLRGQQTGTLTLRHLLSRTNSAPKRATSYGLPWLGMLTTFDLLMYDGVQLNRLPLYERQNRLAELLQADWIGAEMVEQGPAVALMQRAQAVGAEGIMAKRRDSRYTPGRRVSWWLKYKNRHTINALAFDYTTSTSPQRPFGALRLAMVDAAGKVHAVGEVGSGMSEFEMHDLKRRIDNRVFPVVVVSVLGRTEGGFREPVFVKVSTDLTHHATDQVSMEQLRTLPYT